MTKYALIAAAISILLTVEARSEVLLTCPEPEGYIIPIGDKWHNDGHTGQEFSLISNNGTLDIIIGSKGSATSDGATLLPIITGPTKFLIISAYDNAVQVFLFDLTEKEMIFTSMKADSSPFVPDRGGAYVSSCR